MNSYDLAKGIAIGAHITHTYGDKPFTFHLDSVEKLATSIILAYEGGVGRAHALNHIKIIAQLHDVVEDTDMSYERLGQYFDEEIVDGVRLVTDVEAPTRKQKKKLVVKQLHAYSGLSRVRWMSSVVKVADRLHNQGTCITDGDYNRALMYMSEWKDFKESFVKYAELPEIYINLLEQQQADLANLINTK